VNYGELRSQNLERRIDELEKRVADLSEAVRVIGFSVDRSQWGATQDPSLSFGGYSLHLGSGGCAVGGAARQAAETRSPPSFHMYNDFSS
jgi:hypothetical protein